jgi:predicted transglutaminase-like cysteine proteinase
LGKLTTIATIVLLLIFTFLFAKEPVNITMEKLNQIEAKYGSKAKERVLVWDDMMESAKNENTLMKLKLVNDFFNRLVYKRDINNWSQKDYWAAPFEFLGAGAGDCEDYAIAKYFALRQLGIADEQLKITYVTLSTTNKQFEEAHMVLNYYHKPDTPPIVLDNVNKKLVLATQREDLIPVYSFNASGLWKAQNKGKEEEKMGNNNLKNWQLLMERI